MKDMVTANSGASVPAPGKVVTLPQGDANALPPVEQHAEVAPTPLASGPSIGKGNAYLPARYKTQNGNIRTDR